MWEGRLKSRPVGSDNYVLRCYRCIELNPLRAAMVVAPADWPWSGYAANALGREDPHVWTHPAYQSLGRNPEPRMDGYRNLIAETIDPAEIEEIRIYLRRQQAIGNPRYQAAIEAQLARRVAPGKSGRPPGTRRQMEKVL